MPQLDPTLFRWLEKVNELNKNADTRSFNVAEVRQALAAMTANYVTQTVTIASVEEMSLRAPEGHEIQVRIYNPCPERVAPLNIFFHGGGHMAGSVEVYDPIARRLAKNLKQIVASVEYRLSPEFMYPAGLDDARHVVRYLADHLKRKGYLFSDKRHLIGDSGGGALVATLAAESQADESLQVDRQVLIYPSLDYTLQQPAIEALGKGYLLERDRIAWYFEQYMGSDASLRYEASPLFMPVSPELPVTLLITAGFCPLSGEGQAYYQRLKAAGVSVEHHHFGDLIHAYLNLENLVPNACRHTYEQIATFLDPAQAHY
ncbi:hypothetical protein BFW38_07815 [Terasakiispira papahanaumokuakeensis]|uniref:Alpha/beta hydrolase fold-3 domain-containing protein n=1 Tax=Terasakiispira papahanaumokuakeensis TaxID=197479 RepID=A0A1E2V9Y5_9GAMM|nr:alpha/beta hydrolase [Terasakiispira papahanaumokuakeensis]ODC03465.1 hypothetical protein BFW38_07815 [Terasakiispira papahanaumokuakeensis]